jgi:1-acyl-sn-glycerol-3-phosphate acyltransferase
MYKVLSPIRLVLWALWSIFCILISFICYALTFNKRITIWLCKHLWAPMAVAIPGEKLTVIKNSNVDYSKPHVFIANHQSYLDIPSIVHAIDSLLYFVAKKELKKLPFLGQYITISGMIFVDRSNRRKAIESMLNAGKMVKAGKSVLTFPEGTRTKTGDLNVFKKGAFLLAINAGVPIIPIAIEGTGAIFPANKIVFKPGNASLKILDPIETIGYNKNNVQELIDKCHGLISEAKAELATSN